LPKKGESLSLPERRIVTIISIKSGKLFPLAQEDSFQIEGSSLGFLKDCALPLSACRLLRIILRIAMPRVPLRRL
jgi:hypothetical protein